MIPRLVLVGLLGSAVAALGCASQSSGLPNAPIFNTGASATVIPPGAAPPPMPGYGQRVYQGGPAGSSGSYSGSGSGLPGYGAPGGASAYPGAGASAYPGAPPVSGPYPTGQPPLGSDMSMLGGAVTIDTTHIRKRQDALWSNPLFWPFAVVAWPFRKLDEAINGDRDARFQQEVAQRIYQQTGVPMPQATPYGANAHEALQLQHEAAEQQAMQRALQERQAGTASGSVSAAGGGTAPGPAPSIADELAALRAGGTADGPPPPTAAGSPGAPAHSAGSAPIPGAAPADQVEDRNGDGRPDKWVYVSGGRKRVLLDDDHDGRPEKTIYYEPGSDQVSRIDEDTNGDGEVDSWTTYRNGKMAQRRADTNGDGEPDTWTYYQDGQVVRVEMDTNGDGLRDRTDYYEKGKLVRRAEDANGDGHPERITHFGSDGKIVELDEDKNSDGTIDVRSYYSHGKLVRRELLDGR
jgi:hypothetical protein